MSESKSKRIFYYDAVRALAILSVIIIHVFNSTWVFTKSGYAPFPSIQWLFSCFLGSGFRTGVCLFLMLTGALSLGRKWNVGEFFKKRLPRIIVPFIFWGLILSLIYILISYMYPNFLHTVDAFTLKEAVKYIANTYLCINKGFTPYWYVWMIIGVYLILPVFNKWVLNSNLDELEYFLIIWLITCIFDFTVFIELPIELSYFTGPIGLVVAGYYFSKTERKLFNSPYWSLLIVIIGFASAAIMCYLFSTTKHTYIMDRYSIMNITLSIGLFLLFKNFSKFNFHPDFLYNPDGIFRKLVFSLATYSYGMYLVHRFFMHLIHKYFKHTLGYFSLVALMFFATLILTWGLLVILNRIPYVNRVIGVK
ncbi:acyltransferase [Methanobrevibacter sp.]